MSKSPTDYTDEELFLQLETSHAEAERAIIYAINCSYEDPIPCFNEARYGGKHLIRYISRSDLSPVRKKEELRRAISHFQRVKKDAVQYILMRSSQRYTRLMDNWSSDPSLKKVFKEISNSALFRQAADAFTKLPYIASGRDKDTNINVEMEKLEGILDSTLLPLELLYRKVPEYMKEKTAKLEELELSQNRGSYNTNGMDVDKLLDEVVRMYDAVEQMMAFMSIRDSINPLSDLVYVPMGYAGLNLSAFAIKYIQGKKADTALLWVALERIREAYVEIVAPYIVYEFADILEHLKKFKGHTDILRKESTENGWVFDKKQFRDAERVYHVIQPIIAEGFVRKAPSNQRVSTVSNHGKVDYEAVQETIEFIQNFKELWDVYHEELEQRLHERIEQPRDRKYSLLVAILSLIATVVFGIIYNICRDTNKQDPSSTQPPDTQTESEPKARAHN